MVDALNSSPLFEVRGAAFAYRSAPAVRAIDMVVRRGERLALVGANGSGKSTLLRLLAGLSFPDSGSVLFDGQMLSAEQMEDETFFYQFRRRVGVVFQNPDIQLFNASVFDEVAFAPLQLKLPRSELHDRVESALNLMQIAELRHRAPHRLSGGEKKKVALASVLVMNPEVLLLDEPAGALDPRTQSQILELLSSWRDGSKTVVIATHDLDSLEDIADRCCLLSGGQMTATGTPLTMLHDLPLLERAGLIRPHHHAHYGETAAPHGHLHTTDI